MIRAPVLTFFTAYVFASMKPRGNTAVLVSPPLVISLFPCLTSCHLSSILFSTCVLQKEQYEQLDESLLKAHNGLQSCDHQLSQLRPELEVALDQVTRWRRIRDE